MGIDQAVISEEMRGEKAKLPMSCIKITKTQKMKRHCNEGYELFLENNWNPDEINTQKGETFNYLRAGIAFSLV